MRFECKKTENCFAHSQTYEYALPITGGELCPLLTGWETRRNEKLRRPIFSADRDGVNVKGILSASLIRASFPEERWVSEKAKFDKWLEETDV